MTKYRRILNAYEQGQEDTLRWLNSLTKENQYDVYEARQSLIESVTSRTMDDYSRGQRTAYRQYIREHDPHVMAANSDDEKVEA